MNLLPLAQRGDSHVFRAVEEGMWDIVEAFELNIMHGLPGSSSDMREMTSLVPFTAGLALLHGSRRAAGWVSRTVELRERTMQSAIDVVCGPRPADCLNADVFDRLS